ncbi:MAG: AMP-dependent synthetase [Candidatus Chloroheliales bacterium]|nr:MAG: AMP-dependent synthetase [Chloroflexota bacterium]
MSDQSTIPFAHDSAAAVWRPSDEYIERSRLRRFMQQQGVSDYGELMSRSASDVAWFWDAVVKDLDIQFYTPYSQVVDISKGIQWPRWFVGGRYNYVHDALDKRAAATPDLAAIIYEAEEGDVRTLSYAQLLAEVNKLANGLRELGISKGDRVGIFMPLCPETAIATLAVGKIGAIFIPIFSGYAPAAVASRLQDGEAKLLITADGFYRRGKVIAMKEVADEAAAQSPSVEHVLVYPRVGRDVPWDEGRDVWWGMLTERQSEQYETERTDPEDPYMLIYTSGTTGKPKAAQHVHCGFPLKGAQDMAHCFDVQPGDILFWFTDIGWMMGPWAISSTLILGATVFLYDGTPDYPHPDRVWDMVERHRVTHLGISPTAIRGLMGQSEDWVKRHDLSSLRVLGGTGEPWNPEPWRWYFENVGGSRCPIINYSGGTEISGGILGCVTLLPIKPCSFNTAVPGMAADVVDDAGNPVRGAVGELVIRQPWVGMTRGFWKAPERYIDAYWSRLPNIWVHGDWAEIDADGYWYILGRSDDTIKVAGKRVGPAEVESAAVSHPAVQEAAAIGAPNELKGEVVICFVILRPGVAESEALRKEIEDTITGQLGKSLKPEAVRFVGELPKTRNAKIIRRAIRAVYTHAESLGDLSSLENPSALEEIANSR